MNKSETNDYSTLAMQISDLKHGGNVYENAKKLNLLPSEIIDASASLVPFDPPQILIDSLNAEIKNLGFRYYPERNLSDLKEIIGKFHGEEGFRNFSNQKSITFKGFLFDSNLRYPPYERVKKFLKFIFQV